MFLTFTILTGLYLTVTVFLCSRKTSRYTTTEEFTRSLDR